MVDWDFMLGSGYLGFGKVPSGGAMGESHLLGSSSGILSGVTIEVSL